MQAIHAELLRLLANRRIEWRQLRLSCPPPHMAVKMGGGAAQAELLHAMMTEQLSLSCSLESWIIIKRLPRGRNVNWNWSKVDSELQRQKTYVTKSQTCLFSDHSTWGAPPKEDHIIKKTHVRKWRLSGANYDANTGNCVVQSAIHNSQQHNIRNDSRWPL